MITPNLSQLLTKPALTMEDVFKQMATMVPSLPKSSPILPNYQGPIHFFANLVWENDIATYNDITFTQKDGCFDVAHFLQQCNKDTTDKKSIKTISNYLSTDPGKELKRRGFFISTTYLPFKYLDAILTYGFGDAIAIVDYLEGREWRRTHGFLYLIKFIEFDGRFVYKVGRTVDINNRFKVFKNEAKKRGAVIQPLADIYVVNMYIAERALLNYFEVHGAIANTIGSEYFMMFNEPNISEKAHDMRANELFQAATQ